MGIFRDRGATGVTYISESVLDVVGVADDSAAPVGCDVNEADEAEQRRLERHPAPEVLARLPPAAHLLSLKYFSKYGAYTLYTGG